MFKKAKKKKNKYLKHQNMICSNISPLKAPALRGLFLPTIYKFKSKCLDKWLLFSFNMC